MRRSISIGLAIVGAVLGGVSIWGVLNLSFNVGDAAVVEAALTGGTTTTIPIPDETTTTATAPLWAPNDSSLLADLETTEGPKPERLIIDVLGIDAPIGQYGVAANGQMDVPDNITEVGWYKFGPSPGDPGSAVLAAHVDLAGPGRGLFYDLDKLEVDDEVIVSYGDGESRSFRVVARATYLKTELPLDAIFSRDGDPVLTLVTCGGGFSRSTGSYDSNVVVYAVPVIGRAAEIAQHFQWPVMKLGSGLRRGAAGTAPREDSSRSSAEPGPTRANSREPNAGFSPPPAPPRRPPASASIPRLPGDGREG
jgi:LPXTG-site transpeptidase (sortase) family protein